MAGVAKGDLSEVGSEKGENKGTLELVACWEIQERRWRRRSRLVWRTRRWKPAVARAIRIRQAQASGV